MKKISKIVLLVFAFPCIINAASESQSIFNLKNAYGIIKINTTTSLIITDINIDRTDKNLIDVKVTLKQNGFDISNSIIAIDCKEKASSVIRKAGTIATYIMVDPNYIKHLHTPAPGTPDELLINYICSDQIKKY